MNDLKKAYYCNILIVVLEIFAVLWMMSGIGGGPLSASKLEMLRFFTVDSNILAGVFAYLIAKEQKKVLSGKRENVERKYFVYKLIGTVGVTLTLLVTVFFLEPTSYKEFGLFGLFSNSNFFLHLLNPLLCVYSFVTYEKTNLITYKDTLFGIVPMLIYASYYLFEVFTHITNGEIQEGYDWYGFFILGLKSAIFIVPLLILFTYGISYFLYKFNRSKKRLE